MGLTLQQVNEATLYLKNSASATFDEEVVAGQRFEFGKNWTRFLSTLNDQRIERARESLELMLQRRDLSGKRFLDIGCGSGLFSLAARRMGAAVHSFDYDPHSVACTAELRKRYCPDDPGWNVETGSVLDQQYLRSLGHFDVVYSWGVLHHTGSMWQAIGNASASVLEGGQFFIAIYNDQGTASDRWLKVKQTYNRHAGLRGVITGVVAAQQWWRRTARDVLRGRPFASWHEYRHERGMSAWHDIVDWVGGFPFEVARPEDVFRFMRERRFTLVNLVTCGGSLGCNQFVFCKSPGPEYCSSPDEQNV